MHWLRLVLDIVSNLSLLFAITWFTDAVGARTDGTTSDAARACRIVRLVRIVSVLEILGRRAKEVRLLFPLVGWEALRGKCSNDRCRHGHLQCVAAAASGGASSPCAGGVFRQICAIAIGCPLSLPCHVRFDFLPQRYFINNPEAAAAAADQLAPSNIGKQIGGKQAATE